MNTQNIHPFLKKLLNGATVEWKPLGEVCKSITTGLNPRNNFKLNDNSAGKLSIWYVTTKDYSNNEKIEFIEGKTAKITQEAKELINKRSKLEKGDILFSAVGTVGKIALVDIEPKDFDVNESTFVLKPKNLIIDAKFLVHYLKGNIIQNTVQCNLKGSTLSGIRKNTLETLPIPIPPLAVQEELVKILDKFTELTAELTARKKQYEYYRDKLLNFSELERGG